MGNLEERNKERDKQFNTVTFLQIGNFENHYRFQLLIDINGTNAGSTYTKNADYQHIRDRTQGSFAEIALQSTLTTKLQSENMVCD